MPDKDAVEDFDGDLTRDGNTESVKGIYVGPYMDQSDEDDFPLLKSVEDLIGDNKTARLKLVLEPSGKKFSVVIRALNASEFAMIREQTNMGRYLDKFRMMVIDMGMVEPRLSNLAALPDEVLSTIATQITRFSGKCYTEEEHASLKKS